jgi:hypothetical protein
MGYGGIHMADEKPGADGKSPVTGGETKGVRFPEDELTDIEKKADEKAAQTKQGEADQAGKDGEGAQDDDDASVAKLQSFMQKKGVNDISKLVDHFTDLEKKNTLLSQDVQRLSAVTRFPAGEPGAGYAPPGGRDVKPPAEVELPENAIDLVTKPGALKSFVASIKASVRDEVRQEYEQGRQAETVQGLKERVARKMAEDPDKFQSLRPTMYELSFQHPYADIDELYSLAEKAVEAKEAALVKKIESRLGLDKGDAAKLKGVVTRLRTAPISGGTGKQVDLPKQTDVEKSNAELLKAIANADKF